MTDIEASRIEDNLYKNALVVSGYQNDEFYIKCYFDNTFVNAVLTNGKGLDSSNGGMFKVMKHHRNSLAYSRILEMCESHNFYCSFRPFGL